MFTKAKNQLDKIEGLTIADLRQYLYVEARSALRRTRTQVRVRSQLQRKRPLLVYQMGKVGSGSVYKSLKDSATGFAVYHLHEIARQRLSQRRNIFVARGEVPHEKYLIGQMVSKMIDAQQSEMFDYPGCKIVGDKWNIITMVREPVSRNISSFFQNLRYFAPALQNNQTENPPSVDTLADLFLNEFHHEVPLKWLDLELKALTGVDVYAEPFRKSKGYHIYETPRFRVLLLRLRDLNEFFEQGLLDFLGIQVGELKASNVAKNKEYAELYKRFKATVRFSPQFLERMYESQFTKHFYTDEERKTLRERWVEAE
jgi:hypothetical protein